MKLHDDTKEVIIKIAVILVAVAVIVPIGIVKVTTLLMGGLKTLLLTYGGICYGNKD